MLTRDTRNRSESKRDQTLAPANSSGSTQEALLRQARQNVVLKGVVLFLAGAATFMSILLVCLLAIRRNDERMPERMLSKNLGQAVASRGEDGLFVHGELETIDESSFEAKAVRAKSTELLGDDVLTAESDHPAAAIVVGSSDEVSRTSALVAVNEVTDDADFPTSIPEFHVEDSLPAQPQVEPARPIPEGVTDVSAKLYAGDPLSVGMIRWTYAPADRPVIHPDAALFIVGQPSAVFYPAFHIDYADNERHLVREIQAYFLTNASQTLQLGLAVNGERVGKQTEVTVAVDQAAATLLKDNWWAQFCSAIKQGPAAEAEIRHDLAKVLAERLRRATPPSPMTRTASESAIEGHFERAVKLLFGFDSVQLAMQADVDSRLPDRSERADQSMPPAMGIARVPIPSGPHQATVVENIATRVPMECFYVRCQKVANYLWLRNLLVGWGGDLTHIVEAKTLERYPRERIERQLGFDPNAAVRSGIDDDIRDVALIGFDTLFHDGAGLGVLIEAKSKLASSRILKVLQHQRMSLPDSMEVRHDQYHIDGYRVDRLEAPGYQVRSLLVHDELFVLLTNSEELVRRFVGTGRGSNRLSDLQEFKYARSKMPEAHDVATFIYLPDPFFRNMVSPHYRIEMLRRAQAKRDLQQLRVAKVAAYAEGQRVDTVDELVEHGYLPRDFYQRPDGTGPKLMDGRAVDSLRGAPGTFLPMADVNISQVTRSEVKAFHDFTCGYRQQWRLMDPVAVAIRRGVDHGDCQSVNLDIWITPYARSHYSKLRTYLVASDQKEIAGHDDDVLQFNASVRSHGKIRDIYAGLRDKDVEFDIVNGEVVTRNLITSTFGRDRFYLIMTPQSMDALKDVANMLGFRSTAPTLAKIPAAPMIGINQHHFLSHALVGLSLSSVSLIKAMSVGGRIEQRSDWLVMGTGSEFRAEIFQRVFTKPTRRNSMVQLQMQDIPKAKVYPYVRAYTYVTTRQRSAEAASLINLTTQQFGFQSDRSKRAVDYLFQAVPVCPLGGELEARPVAFGPDVWMSSAWSSLSRFEEREVPSFYEFEFVRWLRGLQVEFSLGQNTLKAQVELKVQRRESSEPNRVENPPKEFELTSR